MQNNPYAAPETHQPQQTQVRQAPANRFWGKKVKEPKGSAVIKRETLKRQRSQVERSTAWIVLFVSVLGTVAALAGGFTPLIASFRELQPNWAAVVGGIGIQVVLTFLEWYYFDSPLVSWPARLFDTATTAIGYGPLVLVPMVVALDARGIIQPGYVAWAAISVVSFLIAYYPESRLVD